MRLLKKIFILSLSTLWLHGLIRGVAANIELLPLINKIKNLILLLILDLTKVNLFYSF